MSETLSSIVTFYGSHEFLFFFFLILALIIEWPAIILWISLLAPQLGFSFVEIFLLSFVGDFIGDMIHYIIWRYFANRFPAIKQKTEKWQRIQALESKLSKQKLLDLLVVIKYTAPLTSLGLLYLGYKKVNFKSFALNTFILIACSSLIISSLGYFFASKFSSTENFSYFVVIILAGLGLLYLIITYLSKLLIHKILKHAKP